MLSNAGCHIGHDVWIGHGVIVLPGVTIGNGAVARSWICRHSRRSTVLDCWRQPGEVDRPQISRDRFGPDRADRMVVLGRILLAEPSRDLRSEPGNRPERARKAASMGGGSRSHARRRTRWQRSGTTMSMAAPGPGLPGVERAARRPASVSNMRSGMVASVALMRCCPSVMVISAR